MFADPTKKTLKSLDLKVRKFTRKTLRLPADTPLGAFHSSTSEGGLGIFSLTTGTPALKKRRISRLAAAPDPFVKQAVRDESRPASVPPKYWRNKLHESVDGAGLKEAHPLYAFLQVGYQWDKINEGSKLHTGVKTRLGVLTTPARSARGRDLHGRCDLGCQAPGTLHHIMQVCPRVQPWRITRHNGILDLVEGWLRARDFQVVKEPRITTNIGLRIPDIICHKEEKP